MWRLIYCNYRLLHSIGRFICCIIHYTRLLYIYIYSRANRESIVGRVYTVMGTKVISNICVNNITVNHLSEALMYYYTKKQEYVKEIAGVGYSGGEVNEVLIRNKVDAVCNNKSMMYTSMYNHVQQWYYAMIL